MSDTPVFPDIIVYPTDRSGRPLDAATIFNDFTALYLCGYRVGKTYGLSQDQRRDILVSFMKRPLHPIIIEIFGDEYGEPETMKRLLKMANIIASNCKFRKRSKDAKNYAVAIADWEDDLEFLRRYFYEPMKKGKPHHPWPDTEI